MVTWIKEKATPVLRPGPRLWADYAQEQDFGEVRAICGKMQKLWVDDLNAILPAPIPEIDRKFRDVSEAAKIATEHCITGFTESAIEKEGAGIDSDFATLQEKWAALLDSVAKWSES
jgi:hypothetical protein